MPISDPQPVQMYPAQINIPTETGLFVSVSVQSDGRPEVTALIPQAVQEIVDLLQGWAGRHPQDNVVGQLYDVELRSVTPTHPIPLDGEDESPSTVV